MGFPVRTSSDPEERIKVKTGSRETAAEPIPHAAQVQRVARKLLAWRAIRDDASQRVNGSRVNGALHYAGFGNDQGKNEKLAIRHSREKPEELQIMHSRGRLCHTIPVSASRMKWV